MIRVTVHTRKSATPMTCCACKSSIRTGDRYRQLIGMDTDIWDKGFVRKAAHDSCVYGLDGWELRDGAPPKPRVVQIPDWPVGSKVILRDDFGKEWRTVTRSKPWNVCGHASVLVDGIAGGYICERMRFDTEDVWAALPAYADRAHVGGSKWAADVSL